VLAGALVFMAAMGRVLRTGLGTLVDVVLVVLATALALAALGLFVIVARRALLAWPARLAAALLGAFVLLLSALTVLDAGGRVGIVVAGAIVVFCAALGATAALVVRRPVGMTRGRRAASLALLAVTVAAWVAVAAWVWEPGTDPYVALQPPWPSAPAAALSAGDPSQPGRHAVRFLTYGSGTDRRPEYGPTVALRTATVDASPLLRRLVGLQATVRRWYWGFGAERFPLNGRVWFPEGAGPFPLVLVVHGNHRMEEASDPGYAYLGEVLASRGFIVVSVDQNFLNRSWSGDLRGEIAARGWLLLQHLALWRRWNDTPGQPFHRRVDLERIALIGHSRGGEAVASAAAFNRLPCLPDDCTIRFDFGFSIQALVALAPVDGGHEIADQPVPIENVSYLVLQGSHDGDVPTFEGLRPFKRARFTDGRDRFKAAVYVYRANHSQFNSLWGDDDVGPPFGSFTLRRALLTGEEQRRAALVFVSAFLEATLHGRQEYRPIFRDARTAAAWLPRTTYFTQVEDAGFQVVSDFTRGIDLTRGTLPGSVLRGEHLTVWRLGDVKARMDWPFRVKAVYLGWKAAPHRGTAAYRIALPEATAAGWGLDGQSRLVFMAADTGEHPDPAGAPAAAATRKDPIDFTVEIATADGVVARVPLSRIAPLAPIVRVKFTKWRFLDRAFYRRESEPVFQTYELPLELFEAPGWNPARIREVRLVFDRTASGVIALNEVGFTRPRGPGP
jgi:dienelactone hydrolase